MNSEVQWSLREIENQIAILKKESEFSKEIAELYFLRELLLEQLPYENTDNSTG